MYLRVWDVSKLAVSIYPSFSYNAIGAGGPGRILTGDIGSAVRVAFSPSALDIPPLNFRTAKVLGIPLPPPLQIDVQTECLEVSSGHADKQNMIDGAFVQGWVNVEKGMADLKLKALFLFSIGTLYRAPPLKIETTLTTGTSQGVSFRAEGQSLLNGRGKLVGVASVPATQDPWLNAFLRLPTEALAQLAVELRFSQ